MVPVSILYPKMTDHSVPYSRLSRTTIVLHWLTALAILGMLGLGLYSSQLPRGLEKIEMIQIHKSCGIIVFFILLARLSWRLKEGWPSPASSLQAWEVRLSRSIQWFFLLVPFIMVASGIAKSITYARPVNVFGVPFIPQLLEEKNSALNDALGWVHITGAILITVAIVLHIMVALRHHFIKRDGTLRRMLGFSIPRLEDPPEKQKNPGSVSQ